MTDPTWEYQNSWRASGNFLWAIALLIWTTGFIAEVWLAGAIAASGGLAIAVTTPFFGFGLRKQSAYELDLKLAIINLQREIALGDGVWDNADDSLKNKIELHTADYQNQIDGFQNMFKRHTGFSKSLIQAQAWIVGGSSAIWATGAWIGNLLYHCRSATC